MLILQSWDTSIGDSSKLLEGDEMWGPQCFAFSKPAQETERMGRQSTIRNRIFFPNKKKLFLKEKM